MESKYQITENPLETNGSKASLYLTKIFSGEPGAEFIADFESVQRAKEVCVILNNYAALRAKCGGYERALRRIQSLEYNATDTMLALVEISEIVSEALEKKEVKNG